LAVVHLLEPVRRFQRARQVAAYCGLVPAEHSSGDSQRYAHISKQGNRLLRFLLVEAAHQLVRRGQDQDLRRFYFRLSARKNSSVAVVAVARKLVLRLYRMLREKIDYDEFRRRDRDAGCARCVPSPACAVTE
jgi:transposase